MRSSPSAGASPQEAASPRSDGGEASSSVPVLDSLPIGAVDAAGVPRYLEPFGYVCTNSVAWGPPKVPILDIIVSGHRKVGGHTYYHVTTSLARPGEWHKPFVSWTYGRRLQHLRTALHDPVKEALGVDYRVQFEGTHFASKVHMKGTTSRLNTWCKRLAHGVTVKKLPPLILVVALRALLPSDLDMEEVRRLRQGADGGKAAAGVDDNETVADPNNPFSAEQRAAAGLASPVRTPERPSAATATALRGSPPSRTVSTYSSQFEEYEGGESTGSEDEADEGSPTQDTADGGPGGGGSPAHGPPIFGGGMPEHDEDHDNI